MTDYLRYFFNPDHLFDLRPSLMQPRALLILGVLFIAMIIGGIAVGMLVKKSRDGLKIKGLRRLRSLLITMGCFGLLYWFFAYEGAPILSARFLILVWLAATAVWLGFVLHYLLKVVPKQRNTIESKRQYEKYLP